MKALELLLLDPVIITPNRHRTHRQEAMGSRRIFYRSRWILLHTKATDDSSSIGRKCIKPPFWDDIQNGISNAELKV